MSSGATYPMAVRAQCLTLRAIGKPNHEISRLLGPSERQIRLWLQAAKERGYNPQASIVLKDEYLIDKPRSGRPPKVSLEVVQDVLKDRYAREKSAAEIRFDFEVSDTYVQRLYKLNGIYKRKPTRKPGLTKTTTYV
ncbi:hypothetical protein V502_07922 [Pseudogymnoascus sp. VKM F-4520 (FW-2644)]|nr:hypothetical protein V502_07922 [Pseudogymnoascus sp. VKM F-4520 (FW-2644)]